MWRGGRRAGTEPPPRGQMERRRYDRRHLHREWSRNVGRSGQRVGHCTLCIEARAHEERGVVRPDKVVGCGVEGRLEQLSAGGSTCS